MENTEQIRTILKHCIKKECYGCPLRQNRDCVRSMAFTANRVIMSLSKRIEELEKRNAELEATQVRGQCSTCAHIDSDPEMEPCVRCSNNHLNLWEGSR